MKRSIPILLSLLVLLALPPASRAAIKSLNMNLGLGAAVPSLEGDIFNQSDLETGFAIDAKIGVILNGRIGIYFDSLMATGAAEDLLGTQTTYTQTNIGLLGRFFLPGQLAMYYIEGGAGISMLGLEGDEGEIFSDLAPGGLVGVGFSTYPRRNGIGMDNVRYGLEVIYSFANYGSGEYDPDPGNPDDIKINTQGGILMVMFTIGYEMELPGEAGHEVIKEKGQEPNANQTPEGPKP